MSITARADKRPNLVIRFSKINGAPNIATAVAVSKLVASVGSATGPFHLLDLFFGDRAGKNIELVST